MYNDCKVFILNIMLESVMSQIGLERPKLLFPACLKPPRILFTSQNSYTFVYIAPTSMVEKYSRPQEEWKMQSPKTLYFGVFNPFRKCTFEITYPHMFLFKYLFILLSVYLFIFCFLSGLFAYGINCGIF